MICSRCRFKQHAKCLSKPCTCACQTTSDSISRFPIYGAYPHGLREWDGDVGDVLIKKSGAYTYVGGRFEVTRRGQA